MRKRLLLFSGLILCVSAALSLVVGSLQAQPSPGILDLNHYKIYELSAPVPPVVVTGPMTLTDQFGVVDISEITLEKFGIPVEKELIGSSGEVFPIDDPLLHYTWWAFQFPELTRRVDVVDQFGTYSWRLRDSAYLLAPTAKNSTEIPNGNHYKCYDVDDGPVLNLTVGLADQVDTTQVVVLVGEYFCNPVEKYFQGEDYPIVEPLAHLACYRVDNSKAYDDVEESVTDQFGGRSVTLGPNTYLCLPCEKGDVTATEQSTWGRIKALYR